MNCINGLHKCGVKFVVDHGCTFNGHLECNLVLKLKATRNVRMQSLDACQRMKHNIQTSGSGMKFKATEPTWEGSNSFH